MPHVVHVYKDYWPPIMGGIERSINWMCHGVQELDSDYEFTVLVNSRRKKTRKRKDGNVRIIEVGEWARFASAPLSPSFPMRLGKLKADIWHFHIPNPTGDISYLLRKPKGKIVATYHSDIVRQKWAMAVYGPYLRSFLSNCDAVMPTSPHLIRHSQYLRRVKKKCVPVPLGMPLENFKPNIDTAHKVKELRHQYNGYPIISFVGKLRYYKGLQFLVSAMRGLPFVQLLIVGDGPEKEKLKRLVAEFELEKQIHFLGELPDEEMITVLQASQLFVLPSHLPSEAFGLVQIEAMAAGVPVVSCDVGTGVSFINKHKKTGLIVPPADDIALGEAISEILDNPQLRNRMAEEAFRRAHSKFTREAMSKRLLKVYDRVLKK